MRRVLPSHFKLGRFLFGRLGGEMRKLNSAEVWYAIFQQAGTQNIFNLLCENDKLGDLVAVSVINQ